MFRKLASIPKDMEDLGGGFYRKAHEVWRLEASDDEKRPFKLIRVKSEKKFEPEAGLNKQAGMKKTASVQRKGRVFRAGNLVEVTVRTDDGDKAEVEHDDGVIEVLPSTMVHDAEPCGPDISNMQMLPEGDEISSLHEDEKEAVAPIVPALMAGGKALLSNPAVQQGLAQAGNWAVNKGMDYLKNKVGPQQPQQQPQQAPQQQQAKVASEGDSGKKFKPTQSMANNAKRGMEYRKKNGGKGGTGVGMGMARKLMNGTELTQSEVNKMHSFFSRHDGNQKVKEGKKPHEDNGHIAWLLWGGDSGKNWAASKASSNKDKEATEINPGHGRVNFTTN